MDNFLSKLQIDGESILAEAKDFLVKKYNQVRRNFSYSTAYGQLLLVYNNISQNIFYYILDSTNQTNFGTADRIHSVQGLSRLQGHNPSRGKSAIGKIGLVRINNGNQISGNQIIIPNYTKIKSLNNDLIYTIILSQDFIKVGIDEINEIELKIVQGEFEVQTFTGTGEDLQSLNIQSNFNKMIDDDYIFVSSNGSMYPKYDSIYDIPYKTNGCLVKTGLTDGINVIFGNNYNCNTPKLGETISINYLVNKGKRGNIVNQIPKFDFLDTGFDSLGNDVNLNEFVLIIPIFNPNFGSDPETMELTKIIAPNISRQFIIHDKSSIIYFFSKMNFFSTIKCFREDGDNLNTYNVVLLPIIKNKLGFGEDYFNTDLNNFFVSETEIERLIDVIYEGNRISKNIQIRITNPIPRYFATTIFVELFRVVKGKPVNKYQAESDIKDILNNYFLINKRINKIPHSDIVRIIDELEYVDTVKVVFHPEKEEYLDEKGNILLKETEVAILRGGFIDENGREFQDKFNPNSDILGSVNLKLSYLKEEDQF